MLLVLFFAAHLVCRFSVCCCLSFCTLDYRRRRRFILEGAVSYTVICFSRRAMKGGGAGELNAGMVVGRAHRVGYDRTIFRLIYIYLYICMFRISQRTAIIVVVLRSLLSFAFVASLWVYVWLSRLAIKYAMISASFSYSSFSSFLSLNVWSWVHESLMNATNFVVFFTLLYCGLRKVVAQVKALWCYRYLYSYSYTM